MANFFKSPAVLATVSILGSANSAIAAGSCGEELDATSFSLGLVAGIFGTVATVVAILLTFLRNLSRGDSDGSKMAASAGLVMPSFFFEGAADIFSEVREDSETALRRFRETGNFSEIYNGITLGEQEAMLKALEALKQRFPKTGTRKLVFSAARWAALSSTRLASSLYDFAVIVRRAGTTTLSNEDILSEIWSLDESRCSVSGREPGEGRRPWTNSSADILLDQQSAALRRTTAALLHRPLFAYVAPEIIARPTYLALIRLFDVFTTAALESPSNGEYTDAEDAAVDQFLDQVVRTTVMRRAYRHLDGIGHDLEGTWKETLKQVWFERGAGRPSIFEHVYLGNLTEDAAGQPIAGGLHCWLKFYLEELRGRAKYLGYIYKDPKVGVSDHRFVSGKFVWDHAGYHLVKDQGGFFIGVSPEWQLACGTIAYFETLTPESARRNGWSALPSARTVGYTKDASHEGYRYRHFVYISPEEGRELPRLLTTYASFLGKVVPSDPDASDMDLLRDPAELAEVLPTKLVAEGFCLSEHSQLTEECVAFCIERNFHSLREAFRGLRQVFDFVLEDAFEAAADPAYPGVGALVGDARACVEPLLEAASPGPLSASLPELLERLRLMGRRGPRLHRPLRFLLTGHGDGAPVATIARILELAEKEGGDAVGVSLQDRLQMISTLFALEKVSAETLFVN